jgi:hypothetical protein
MISIKTLLQLLLRLEIISSWKKINEYSYNIEFITEEDFKKYHLK